VEYPSIPNGFEEELHNLKEEAEHLEAKNLILSASPKKKNLLCNKHKI